MTLLTKKELMKTLSIDKNIFREIIEAGIPHLKIGRQFRFFEDKAVEWFSTYKPSQAQLEQDFIDSKGRKIKDYVQLDEVARFLKLSKSTLYRLCKTGMPFVIIGEKRFFNLSDIVDHFQVGDQSTNEPLHIENKEVKKMTKRNKTEEKVTLIVDGSHNPITGTCGTGMILHHKDELKGYSKVHRTMVTNPSFCEYLAILDALQFVKKKGFKHATIGTDQMVFVESFQKGDVRCFNWTYKEPFKAVFDDICNLLKELDGIVDIIYANDKTYKNMYQNAHALSRFHVEKVLKLKPEEKIPVKPNLITDNHLGSLRKKSVKNVHPEQKVLEIEFIQFKGSYSLFNVSFNGKVKQTRINTTKASIAAVLLAKNYAEQYMTIETVKIGNIPTFKKEMDDIFSKKGKSMKTIARHYHYLINEIKLDTVNPYSDYLTNNELKAAIA